MQLSTRVLIVTSGCLIYNCVALLTATRLALEKIAISDQTTPGAQAGRGILDFTFFTNAASDVALICGLYFKECTKYDQENHKMIGLMKMFMAWNAVTIILSWIAACLLVYYSSTANHASTTANNTEVLLGLNMPSNGAVPEFQMTHFWPAVVVITIVAALRVCVLVLVFRKYLSALQDEVEAFAPVSMEPSTNSMADPRYPWRWFQHKLLRRISRCRSVLQTPGTGLQSRRDTADPSRQRTAQPTKKVRSPSGADEALRTCHDPVEMVPASLLGSDESPMQGGAALHVVPNVNAVKYVWHQSSDWLQPSIRSPPSQQHQLEGRRATFSFDAMEHEARRARSSRYRLSKNFEESEYIDADAVLSSKNGKEKLNESHPKAEGKKESLSPQPGSDIHTTLDTIASVDPGSGYKDQKSPPPVAPAPESKIYPPGEIQVPTLAAQPGPTELLCYNRADKSPSERAPAMAPMVPEIYPIANHDGQGVVGFTFGTQQLSSPKIRKSKCRGSKSRKSRTKRSQPTSTDGSDLVTLVTFKDQGGQDATVSSDLVTSVTSNKRVKNESQGADETQAIDASDVSLFDDSLGSDQFATVSQSPPMADPQPQPILVSGQSRAIIRAWPPGSFSIMPPIIATRECGEQTDFS